MSEDVRVQALREAVRIAPDDAGLRRLYADALLAADQPDEAAAEYRTCLRAEPDHRDTLLGLARAFQASGKRSAALLAIEDLLERTGDDGEASLLQATILLQAGRVEEAVTAYRAAVTAGPRFERPELAAALGVALTAPATDPAAASPATPAPTPAPDPDAAGLTPRFDDVVPGDDDDGDDGPDIPTRVPVHATPGAEGDPTDRASDIERPKVTFAHVGGMESLKDEIRLKIIAPLEHPELYAAYGKASGGGILLYGPPGCGKTHLARATAGEIRASFLSVGIDDVLDMWLGQSERNLHELFTTARRHAPSVLFFDEVDAIGGNRTDMRGSAGRTVVNQFLAELDGIEADNEGMLVLAATNAPWHLDPAFRRPGRFDRVLFVPPPDQPARGAILRLLLEGKPVADVDHDAIAKRTDGFSGADLKGVVDRVVEMKLHEAIRDRIPRPITTQDLQAAAKQTVPTTREWFATARNYVLYANQGGLYDAVRPYLKL